MGRDRGGDFPNAHEHPHPQSTRPEQRQRVLSERVGRLPRQRKPCGQHLRVAKNRLILEKLGQYKMGDDEPQYDVAVNVMKGKEGYGIYFTNREGQIRVTKLDAGSEAERAGVQAGDILYSVQDNDKRLPTDNPGAPVLVDNNNYQQTLQLVREMSNCRLCFIANSSAF